MNFNDRRELADISERLTNWYNFTRVENPKESPLIFDQIMSDYAQTRRRLINDPELPQVNVIEYVNENRDELFSGRISAFKVIEICYQQWLLEIQEYEINLPELESLKIPEQGIAGPTETELRVQNLKHKTNRK